ncbi:hypothetical protein [Desulfoscipio sp. XC116]|uniref:hypothetical protein n=1 Tax=Desulfoscipio sp. XC116 TaxID=3144975 RepID=UPI00325BDA69
MGKLKAVWTDLPDADDEVAFKKEFNRYFGADWDKLLLGADKPFDHHRYWDGYCAVADVLTGQVCTLLDVTGAGSDGVKPLCYNMLVV